MSKYLLVIVRLHRIEYPIHSRQFLQLRCSLSNSLEMMKKERRLVALDECGDFAYVVRRSKPLFRTHFCTYGVCK